VTLLLDTHVALWALTQPHVLASDVRARIAESPRVLVSAASVWEVSIKAALGKLDAPAGFAQACAEAGFEELPVRSAHAEAVRSLPAHHADPFDRLLVAQALLEGAVLVTADSKLRPYAVPLLET
jgi:PIN domain nuclease of toxin-antitoxin system